MIKGIGTDIVEIARIKKSIENKRFLDKYFTAQENTLFKKRDYRVETIAGNFAVKEAVSKVLGTGFIGFTLTDIEVLRDHRGKPYIHLYREAKNLAQASQIRDIHVSISHSEHYVVAVAIGEGAM